MAKIAQINVSPGGVPKLPIPEGVVGPRGLEGDSQADKVHHGKPDQALCLWSAERIAALAAEGHPIFPGAAGENLTLEGIEWDTVVPGNRYRLGAELEIEITGFATPCKKNAGWFANGDFNRVNHRTNPGWSRAYARVLTPGALRPGDEVTSL